MHANGMVETGSIDVKRRFRSSSSGDRRVAARLDFNEFLNRERPVTNTHEADGMLRAILMNSQV